MDHNSDTSEEPQQQHQKDADEEPSDTEVTEPPKKKSKTDKLAKGQVKLGQIFKKLKEQKTSTGSTPSTTGIITVSEKLEFELDHYIKSPMTDPESDPLEWWKINNIHYPLLAKIAKKYLSICATSCPSERLFSSSGKIVSTL